MPWKSWNARKAAFLRMERASARTMAEEMAARWCGKKDWGEARPSPYCVESCPVAPCVAFASAFIGGGSRAGARDRGRRWTVGGEQVHDVRPFGFAQRARRGWEVAGPGWRRRGRRLSPCGGRAAGQWVRLVPFAVLRIQCYYWLRMPRHLPVSNKVTTPRGLVVFLGLGVGK